MKFNRNASMVSINLTSVSLFRKVFHLGSWKTKRMGCVEGKYSVHFMFLFQVL